MLRLVSGDGTNRLSAGLLEELAGRIEAAGGAGGVIITGNARYFSVGADLGEIGELSGFRAWLFSRRGQQALDRIAASRVPVVAAMDGFCMGGGFDLALACHARVCTGRACFGHRGAALGLVTGWGGTQRLPRLVGPARALELFLTAAVWDANEAMAAGLVREIAASGDLLARAAGLARRLASRAVETSPRPHHPC